MVVMVNDTLAMIRAKREAKKAERAALDANYRTAVQRIAADEADLEIAERVVLGLDHEAVTASGAAEIVRPPSPPSPPAVPPESPPALTGGRRPDGVPPLPEMIKTILREAHGTGLKGMEPKDIRTKVADRWWPEVKDSSVGSVAWRMWKNKQLTKDDDALYALPPDSIADLLS